MATGDPHTTEFKQKMDELNYFMGDMHITQAMRVRAREYFRNTRDLRKKLSYHDLLDRLSHTLRGEVVLQMSQQTLETVWYLRSCEPGFLVELAVLMQREGYAPREKIPSLKLCIVMRGVAAKAGNILALTLALALALTLTLALALALTLTLALALTLTLTLTLALTRTRTRTLGGQHPHRERPLGRGHDRLLACPARHAPRLRAHLRRGGHPHPHPRPRPHP